MCVLRFLRSKSTRTGEMTNFKYSYKLLHFSLDITFYITR